MGRRAGTVRCAQVSHFVGLLIRLKMTGPIPGGDGHHGPTGSPVVSLKADCVTGSRMKPLPTVANEVG